MVAVLQIQPFVGSIYGLPHAKHFTYLASWNVPKGPVRWVLVLTHFYR